MFTGLIEEQGTVKNISLTSYGMELTVECRKILSDIKLGASVCINGACQSVTEIGNDFIKVLSSNETLDITNFKGLKSGDKVNLERALTLSSRLDGHIVSGHVDTTAQFLHSEQDGFSVKMFFELPQEYCRYIIYKGSISVNGVSLTVASIIDNMFSVEIIPDTLAKTNLSSLKKGDIVNIETDLFAKYIEKICNSDENKSSITYGFLAENGFV